MDYKYLCKLYAPQKIVADKLNMNYLSKEDVDVCNYVSNQLLLVEKPSLNLGDELSLERLIDMSLEEIKIFGDDIYSKISSLQSEIDYCVVGNKLFQFYTEVFYTYKGTSKEIDINSGKVLNYTIPIKFFELSVYYLAHEHIHALKETNYNEYINALTYGEVIPLFYELLAYDAGGNMKIDIIKCRLNGLLDNKGEFLIINELCNQSKGFFSRYFGNYKLYEYCRGIIGGYLNSFYYAIILYNMYKQSPKKILDMVSKVLKHEITTIKMLEQLGIYGDIKGEVFEKELGNIKKRIK